MTTVDTPRTRRLLPSSLTRLNSAATGALLVLMALLAACTSPYRHAQLRPADAGFAGIDDSFTAQTPEVDVLLVHGMGTHDSSWVQTLVSELTVALGFPPPNALPTPELLKNGAQLYRFTLSDSKRQLHVTAVLWSPVTSPAKLNLC